MRIPCETIQDLLPLYCDGVCSEESRRLVEEHLQDCGQCREELRLLRADVKSAPTKIAEEQVTKAAATAWKKGKNRAFLTGCVIVWLILSLLFVGYRCYHWFSTVDESDLHTLAQQSYSDGGILSLTAMEQKGNYTAALYASSEGSWYLCVFQRDTLFQNRWHIICGKSGFDAGKLTSWNYGSPQGEAILVFCGGGLSDEICWYTFQNRGITYTCPVEDGYVLDLFILLDQNDINGHPTALNADFQEIHPEN